MNSDLVIIGSGPAGLSAAVEAARCGAAVSVLDENDRPGGQLFLQTHKFFGSRHHRAGVRGFQIGVDLLKEAETAGIEMRLNTVVWGVFPDLRVAFSRNGSNDVDSVQAKTVLIATGALEKTIYFKGWTRPGVMGAGAAQNMMHVQYVLPGRKVLIVGSGNVGLIVAYQLRQAGAEVVGVVEALPRISGYQVHAGKIRRLGIPILTSCTIKEAVGDPAVQSAVLVRLDAAGKMIPGSEMEIRCDLVCLATGLRPFDELCWSSGVRTSFVRSLGGFVALHDQNMETSRKGLYVAGDVTGVEEANTAMDEGRLAGIAVAERLGKIPSDEADLLKKEIQSRLRALRMGTFGAERAEGKKTILSLLQVNAKEGDNGRETA
jgi:thioredoxin reductase